MEKSAIKYPIGTRVRVRKPEYILTDGLDWNSSVMDKFNDLITTVFDYETPAPGERKRLGEIWYVLEDCFGNGHEDRPFYFLEEWLEPVENYETESENSEEDDEESYDELQELDYYDGFEEGYKDTIKNVDETIKTLLNKNKVGFWLTDNILEDEFKALSIIQILQENSIANIVTTLHLAKERHDKEYSWKAGDVLQSVSNELKAIVVSVDETEQSAQILFEDLCAGYVVREDRQNWIKTGKTVNIKQIKAFFK